MDGRALSIRRSWPVAVIVVLTAIVVADAGWQFSASTTTRAVAPACGVVSNGSASDCVRHQHKGTPKRVRVALGHDLALQLQLHPSLAQTNVAIDVQLRSVTTKGPIGTWHTTRVYAGSGKQYATDVMRDLHVSAPTETGVYLVRTRVSWGDAVTTSVRENTARLLAATFPPDGLVAQKALSKPTVVEDTAGCVPSPEDMEIVELFNELSFNEDIVVNLGDNGSAFTFIVQCGDNFALPPQFQLRLTTSDGAQTTDCKTPSAPISIDLSLLSQGHVDYCVNRDIIATCGFLMVLSNSVTGSIYSMSLLDLASPTPLPIQPGPPLNPPMSQQIIPELQPATLCVPIAPPNPSS